MISGIFGTAVRTFGKQALSRDFADASQQADIKELSAQKTISSSFVSQSLRSSIKTPERMPRKAGSATTQTDPTINYVT